MQSAEVHPAVETYHTDHLAKAHLTKAVKPLEISLGLKHVSISSLNPPKHLLRDVSAYVAKGGITAVMGPSSSGKSLLMKYLCGRLPTLKSTGEVTLDGKPIDPHKPNGFGFVPQEDVLIGDITVRETLEIAAELRKDQPVAQSKADVEAMVGTLGITHVKDNVIGTVMRRGLSGGQKRRVSLGTELVVRPAVAFLDEPTSGLDGTTAFDVIKAIRTFATSSGGDFSVLLSIHQSSLRIVSLFDHIMFLGRGGCVFFGTLPEAIVHFTDLGHPPPAHQNPSDFFMQVTDDAFGRAGGKSTDFLQAFATSQLASSTIGAIDAAKHAREQLAIYDDDGGDGGAGKSRGTGFWRQYLTLTRREAIMALRDPTLYYLQFGLHAFYGFMIGAIFWNAPTVMDDRLLYLPGSVLWLLMLQSYMHVFKVFYLWTSNGRFTHERANGSYGVFAFWCSELTVTAFSHLITFPGFAVGYFMVGLPAESYPFVLLVSYTMSMTAESMLNLSTKFFPQNISFAIVAAQAILTLLTIFGGGIFIPFNKVPGYWQWLMQLSIFTQSSRAAMSNIFKRLTYTCPAGYAQAATSTSATPGYVCATLTDDYPCIDGTYLAADSTCDSDGSVVLNILTGGTGTDQWRYFGYLVALLLSFRVLVLFLEYYPWEQTKLFVKSLLAGPTRETLLQVEMDLMRLRGEVHELRSRLAAENPRDQAATAVQSWYRKKAAQRDSADASGSARAVLPAAAAAGGEGGGTGENKDGADISGSGGVPVARARSSRQLSGMQHGERSLPRQQLSFSGASTFLSFESVRVTLPGSGKALIDDVTGFATSGRCLAIMGPSGAGKTTLLNALSGRAVYADVTGRLRLGERPMTADDLDYVPQFDDLNDFFTVRELLLYMASLKCTDGKKRRRVSELIHILGLTAKADARTGTLSGGEKKRVSIGMGMVSQPTVLFLDEPTTGLDSVAAWSVVDYITRVARQTNVICVLTIHQPSGQVFEMLEDLMLLEQGRLAYMGTRDRAERYFAAAGAFMPREANRADYYMDLISEPPTDGGLGWQERYRTSEIRMDFPACVAAGSCTTPIMTVRPSLREKFDVLLQAQLLYYWRNSAVYWIRAMMLFVVAVYVGTMYPRLNHTTANLTEMSGAAFFNVWCVLFAVISATPSFVVDRRVALEEMLNGAYGPATHCLAQFVASMPFTAASAFIYQAIFHFIVGFNDSFESYMFASLLTITLLLMMEAIMLMVTQGLKNDMLSCTFSMVVLGMFFLFPGFFIKTDDMPPAISWMSYLIATRYAFNGYLYAIFHGQEYAVSGGSGSISGDTILVELFGQRSNERAWPNLAIMIAWVLLFRFNHYAMVWIGLRPYNSASISKSDTGGKASLSGPLLSTVQESATAAEKEV